MDTVQSKNAVSYGPEMVSSHRLVERETEPEMAMKITALWMWFETQGYGEKLQSKISENDDENFISSVVEESMAILAILDPDSTTPFSPNLFSNTATLVKPSPDSLSKIFNDCREIVSKGVVNLYNELICNSFNDVEEERREINEEAKEEERVNEEEKVEEEEKNRNNGETLNSEKRIRGSEPSKTRFVLNPFAEEWHPNIQAVPEESRCIFLTFSNGYPLSEREIVNFFTKKYGPCVERVYIHYPVHRRNPPLFGKVVFTAMSVAAMVLAGEEEAKFLIGRRPLWCKKYDVERNRWPAGYRRRN